MAVPDDNEPRAGDGNKGTLMTPPSDELAIVLAEGCRRAEAHQRSVVCGDDW
jgi:hypothetical protein